MAIDRTFNFGSAVNITHEIVADFFNTTDIEKLEELDLPTTSHRAISDLLNGDLDHVVLRRAIEQTLETTTV
tara:strand:- start:938 stop:1153 length:216 start_codon:yes stop_codon:yes gene_type:complete